MNSTHRVNVVKIDEILAGDLERATSVAQTDSKILGSY